MTNADLYLKFKRFNEQDQEVQSPMVVAPRTPLTLQQQLQQRDYLDNQKLLHTLSLEQAAHRRRTSLEDRNAGYIEFEKLRKAQKYKNEQVRQELFSY